MLCAGKVTVGLALHWPYVMDSVGLSTYGLNGQFVGMSTPPRLLMRHGLVCFLMVAWHSYACGPK